MFAKSIAIFNHGPGRQHGAALMIMLVILVVGAAAILVSSLTSSALKNARDNTTAEALAQAKDALVGYAVSVDLTSSARPGDLPCPDTNNDGIAETSCGNASGSTGQTQRIGRLPWKTLGLPDLRDGSGERLWYAVSNNFKNNTRTTCTNSNLSGCLNSDTPGTISVFASDGTQLNDGSGNNGAVAIIIAPGDVLTRQGGTLQDRSGAGINNASNYLDIATVGGNTKDNANFTDGSSTNGFIQGLIKDSNGNTIVNDRLLVIKQDDIIFPLQKRVAAEVKNCLVEYAAMPQNQGPPPNQGYYPWATSRSIAGSTIVYNDSDQLEFGHIPDIPFTQTCSDTGGSNCSSTQNGGMKNQWNSAGTCTLTNMNWWVNWKEMVFYGIAHSLRPHDLTKNYICPGATCLTVNPPSTANDKSFVVIVAGKKMGTQARNNNTDKSTLSNYLEGQNSTGISPFEQSPASTTYNDITVFK
jgi:hypothetical protein